MCEAPPRLRCDAITPAESRGFRRLCPSARAMSPHPQQMAGGAVCGELVFQEGARHWKPEHLRIQSATPDRFDVE